MPTYPDVVEDAILDSQTTLGTRIVTKTDSLRTLDILEQILTVLKKIEYHQMLATDVTLHDQDV